MKNIVGASKIIENTLLGFVAKDISLISNDKEFEQTCERSFELLKKSENEKLILNEKIPKDILIFF